MGAPSDGSFAGWIHTKEGNVFESERYQTHKKMVMMIF